MGKKSKKGGNGNEPQPQPQPQPPSIFSSFTELFPSVNTTKSPNSGDPAKTTNALTNPTNLSGGKRKSRKSQKKRKNKTRRRRY